MKLHSLRNHTLGVAAGSLRCAFGGYANDDPMRMDTSSTAYQGSTARLL